MVSILYSGRPHKFLDDNGNDINSTFLVEEDGESLSVILESAGAKDYNRQYDEGLRLLLRRLSEWSTTILRVAVDSSKAREKLAVEEQRVLPSFREPMRMPPFNNLEPLRLAMQREQQSIGQKPGAKGGNRQKRIRIRVSIPEARTPQLLERLILGEDGPRAHAAREFISLPAPDPFSGPAYDPSEKKDERKRMWAQIRVRLGQGPFREQLLRAYGARCPISGCDATDALEAAHIQPYRGTQTHHVENGLLLRADLHTLFDMSLLTVASSDWSVVLSPSLREGSYRRLHGSEVRPMTGGHRPNARAIDGHREACGF
jgi:hypothetical protein